MSFKYISNIVVFVMTTFTVPVAYGDTGKDSKITLDYLGVFLGPSVIFNSSYVPGTSTPINLKSQIKAAYKTSDTTSIGVVLSTSVFFYQLEPKVNDPSIAFTKYNLLNSNYVRLTSDARVAFSTDSLKISGLQSYHTLKLMFPGTSLALYSFNAVQYGLESKTLSLSMFPVLVYPVNRWFRPGLLSIATVSTNTTLNDAVVGPGASFWLTRDIVFSPAVTFKLAGPIDNPYIIAFLQASIL
jgi:hypothetical protein